MKKSKYIRAEEITDELKISIASAYRLIKSLNKELSDLNIITFAGRIDRNYYEYRMRSNK